jgi:hypothetical protein
VNSLFPATEIFRIAEGKDGEKDYRQKNQSGRKPSAPAEIPGNVNCYYNMDDNTNDGPERGD